MSADWWDGEEELELPRPNGIQPGDRRRIMNESTACRILRHTAINLDGCWDFVGYHRPTRRGSRPTINVRVPDGRWVARTASRVVLEVWTGRTLEDNEVVCHTCDNPSCVRPSHLYVGTHSQNLHDQYDRGRRWSS